MPNWALTASTHRSTCRHLKQSVVSILLAIQEAVSKGAVSKGKWQDSSRCCIAWGTPAHSAHSHVKVEAEHRGLKHFSKCSRVERFRSGMWTDVRYLSWRWLSQVRLDFHSACVLYSSGICQVGRRASTTPFPTDVTILLYSGWGGPKLRPALHDYWPSMVQPIATRLAI